MRFFLLIIISIKTLVFTLLAEPKYNFDVKPILSDRCYHCHGPDKETRKAKLRLDTEEGIKKALEGGELIARITSDDPEEIMPPPESKLSVDSDEIKILKQWIDSGANLDSQWSFMTIEKIEIPSDKNQEHPIDAFINKKLKSNGMNLSNSASPEKLIKRVAFDLTGLPPSKDEIEKFTEDDSPEAYEKMVDKFLSKSSYGERMASHWLDTVSYTHLTLPTT